MAQDVAQIAGKAKTESDLRNLLALVSRNKATILSTDVTPERRKSDAMEALGWDSAWIDEDNLGMEPPMVMDAHNTAVFRTVCRAYVGKIFREYIRRVDRVRMIGIIPGVGPKENIDRMPARLAYVI